MAFTCIVSAVCRDTADYLIRRDLAKQVRQHRRITDAAICDLDRTYFQCLFIDTNVYLAPKAAFRTAKLVGVPLPFALSFNAGAIDEQM